MKGFLRLLQLLPVAALIDENIFYMHGELSPNFNNLDQIKNLRHPTDLSYLMAVCSVIFFGRIYVKALRICDMNNHGVSNNTNRKIECRYRNLMSTTNKIQIMLPKKLGDGIGRKGKMKAYYFEALFSSIKIIPEE
ncbi:hypothetical protein OSB04_025790 [Centaurea solstitialis]|uniref:Uncharacterized protein n=1 Tax=Centaurea solstitialis TaxID=347529 RepID=A0AA38T869_9ASTR|nr:hypothetical protein OSB04_025790 [Centaurea solstitialis]